jgi:heat-inducible transcriptional repressor
VKDRAEEGDALQQLLRETTTLLSKLTNLLAAATIVKDHSVLIRHAIVSAIGPYQALLVVVLSNGTVENRMVECPVGLTLEDVGQVNEALGTMFNGKTLRSVTRLKPPSPTPSESQNKLTQLVWNAIRSMAKDTTKGAVVTEGEEYMIAQPEFRRDVRLLADVLESLSDSETLYDTLQSPAEQGRTITIGNENRPDTLNSLSIVRQSFYVGENEAGVIAVIGPKRMHYESSIPLVNYTAQALSEALTRFMGV